MSTSSAGQPLQQRVAAAILEGAAGTWPAQGSGAGINDVAAAAGVARATVYRYFPTRQVLLDELALFALREADHRIGSARIEEVSTHEAVARVVRALVDIGDAFVVVAREKAGGAEFDRTLAGPLARLFERGQASGDVRDDLPVSWLREAPCRRCAERAHRQADARTRGYGRGYYELASRRRAPPWPSTAMSEGRAPTPDVAPASTFATARASRVSQEG